MAIRVGRLKRIVVWCGRTERQQLDWRAFGRDVLHDIVCELRVAMKAVIGGDNIVIPIIVSQVVHQTQAVQS